jgi:hypothetical protein
MLYPVILCGSQCKDYIHLQDQQHFSRTLLISDRYDLTLHGHHHHLVCIYIGIDSIVVVTAAVHSSAGLPTYTNLISQVTVIGYPNTLE